MLKPERDAAHILVPPMTIAYFVQDVTDPAVVRRVKMILSGGGEVLVLGFRRKDKTEPLPNGVEVFDLGRTYDAQLVHRAFMALSAFFRLFQIRDKVANSSVVIARNLEMLFVVQVLRVFQKNQGGVVYEVLDIHRIMLRQDLLGRAMRGLERILLRGVRCIIVSSPAFEREYYRKIQKADTKILLLENKILAESAQNAPRAPERPEPGPVWRIGWFGMIRCQKSLDLLDRLTQALPGKVLVDIRGQPSLNVFRDFNGQIQANDHLRFYGRYAPDDLLELYGACHFVWAIDFYEENMNSDWLLPNRLYEGGASSVPIIALKSVETGRWLKKMGAGVLLDDPAVDLAPFFSELTPVKYEGLRHKADALPRSALVYTQADYRAFLQQIGAVDEAV